MFLSLIVFPYSWMGQALKPTSGIIYPLHNKRILISFLFSILVSPSFPPFVENSHFSSSSTQTFVTDSSGNWSIWTHVVLCGTDGKTVTEWPRQTNNSMILFQSYLWCKLPLQFVAVCSTFIISRNISLALTSILETWICVFLSSLLGQMVFTVTCTIACSFLKFIQILFYLFFSESLNPIVKLLEPR